MKRLFSKDENIAVLEYGTVAILGILLFAGGFMLGQLWSIGEFLIWAVGKFI